MKFVARNLISDPNEFTGVNPFLASLLAKRTSDTRHLSGLKNLMPPVSMKGLDEAAKFVAESITKQRRILIVGDYDADGCTGTATGICGLRMMGAKHLFYIIPNRFTEGYGLSVDVLNRALEHRPELIITVDNGISAHAGIHAANQLGIPVVVTDHHLPSDTLPDAQAIVNPNQNGCQFESKSIAGVGVMFYLMIAVRQCLRSQNMPGGDAPLQELLDLVAIGTIADVVRLDYNNRLMVNAGLARIRAGNTRAGVLQLFNSAKRNFQQANSEDLGFVIGPRINSAGRMDDATTGIECLTSLDDDYASRLAQSLHATNQERRNVQKSIETEAISGIPTHIPESQKSICLYDPSWHQGVIGVVAGRLKEKFYRPTIVFTKISESSAKGSARSIPGLHLRDCLDIINKTRPGLIHKFGGHAAAAGLDIDVSRMEEFSKVFEDTVSNLLTPEDLRQVVEHDGLLSPSDFNLTNADDISSQVWGQGFTSPQFILDDVKIQDQRVLNEAHLKLKITIGSTTAEAIWFGQPSCIPQGSSLLTKISINEWNGNRKPQLMITEQVS